MPSIRVHKNLFILDSFQIRINRSYVKGIKIKKIKIHTATNKEASHRYFFFPFFFFQKNMAKKARHKPFKARLCPLAARRRFPRYISPANAFTFATA